MCVQNVDPSSILSKDIYMGDYIDWWKQDTTIYDEKHAFKFNIYKNL